ncbi:MAG: cation transporter [Rhabdochlamydiaceae bacterium]|nr:cation transporter [Rhabdochlamydiaceae bacterium]
MNACHHDHSHIKALHGALWIAVVFMLVEIIGGWMANSLALISDALHMFTDVGALLLGLIVSKIAHRPSTPNMSYGYQRAEILGALVSAVSLWVLCGVLSYEAIHRFFKPEIVEGRLVFWVATAGLLANLVMLKLLHPTKGQSLNVRAAYLHVLGDLLGSVGVIISGIILWIFGWYLIDPIITILFTLFILRGSGKVIRESISILMEATPEGIDPTAVKRELASLEGVKEVHDLHIWSASIHRVALSVHLVADEPSEVLIRARECLEKIFNILHVTIQVEDSKDFESRYCYDCQNNL